jgi:hypothetical protein
MSYIPQSQANTGLYIPTTTVIDTINSNDQLDPGLKQILVVLYQTVNNIAVSLNQKESGIHDLTEFVTGQNWFNPNPSAGVNNQPRSHFRKMFYLTSLPAGVTAFNHLINGTTPLTADYTFTGLHAMANNTASFDYYPIPFASAGGAANIEIRANSTQIVITNNSGVTFNKIYVFAEYLKY